MPFASATLAQSRRALIESAGAEIVWNAMLGDELALTIRLPGGSARRTIIAPDGSIPARYLWAPELDRWGVPWMIQPELSGDALPCPNAAEPEQLRVPIFGDRELSSLRDQLPEVETMPLGMRAGASGGLLALVADGRGGLREIELDPQTMGA